jgi:hypothetical protein
VEQSGALYAPGLPRRYAPRNDGDRIKLDVSALQYKHVCFVFLMTCVIFAYKKRNRARGVEVINAAGVVTILTVKKNSSNGNKRKDK